MTVSRTAAATPTVSRSESPLPTAGTTLHLIGDTHVGGITQARLDKVLMDLKSGNVPTPAVHLQLGDNTDNGLTAEDDTFKGFMRQLPAPWKNVMGNHDILSSVRTPAAWASAYGYASQNYTFVAGPLTVIVIGPDAYGDGSSTFYTDMSPTTLTWLDAQLTANASRPCVIACHFPLYDTVGGDSSLEYVSTQQYYFITSSTRRTDSNDITAVLAAHSNVVGYVAGHTHSSLNVPGLAFPLLVGSRLIASVNASCIYYCGKSIDLTDPICTLFATWLDDRFEIRFRDHGKGGWGGPPQRRVITVPVG